MNSPLTHENSPLPTGCCLLMQTGLPAMLYPIRSVHNFSDVVVPSFCQAGAASVRKEPSVHVYGNCDSIPRVPAVVQVIAVFGVNDIHIIVVVPIVRPVLWPWVHETEPKASVLEPRIPAIQLHRVPVDVEPVIRPKAATIVGIWNAVAGITATLPPIAVLGLPVTCAMLLPHCSLLIMLHSLPLL